MQFCPTDASLSAAIVTKYRAEFRTFVRRPAPEVDVSDMAEPHTTLKHLSKYTGKRGETPTDRGLTRDERNRPRSPGIVKQQFSVERRRSR
jgi:hypothetical protein